ncbi:hypothetical protein EIN_197530 [Entamoeba invadens IP1]|uniref:Uncharacterized protein n=1 Tax=Entamoeba invadens IP1 TaxID=370355 RepID=A0A0A1TUQ4_ENTIV|nr:hypothetical protein EIN_197530 [Entamoeba invadens IP1]ELP83830.1 hypothetical protein EIN_197530 [Entamoeba invadens IP1]|eukprot:XP_004183176.1 hypothetical protein EIN_197530 [Entamoeba invadens IP1]
MLTTQPQVVSNIVLSSPPLRSVIYNNSIITITDDNKIQTSQFLENFQLTNPVITSIKPTVSSIVPTQFGLLSHQHSQPIQLLSALKTKPTLSYNPLPTSNSTIYDNKTGFYTYHSSTLFKYKIDYSEPVTSKRLKMGAVSSIAKFGSSNFLACGSYDGYLSVVGGDEMEVYNKIDLKKGITALRVFDDNILFVATRKDDKMYVFDFRNFANPVALLVRSASTNQRIGFDIINNTLVTGNDNGNLYFYNTKTFAFIKSLCLSYAPINDVFFFNDEHNITITSGERYYETPKTDLNDSSDDGVVLKESIKKYNLINTWKI